MIDIDKHMKVGMHSMLQIYLYLHNNNEQQKLKINNRVQWQGFNDKHYLILHEADYK